MHIEELGDEDSGGREGVSILVAYVGGIGFLDAKRAMVGVGARVLFYPTLMYNVIRNKIQSEFRWWDEVDEFLLLGAVPFPSDVPRLKQLGVHGVITLNEPYETLVPTSLYFAHGIEHLVIPTRDYLFAPSFGNIRLAVDFIHRNASSGKTTYIHCKAGRGRSTTIVLCYLMQHRQMTPNAAYEYVRVRRPRVLLASSQWQAVQEYYYHLSGMETEALDKPSAGNLDDSSFVLVSHSDIDDGFNDSEAGNGIMSELRLMYRLQFARQAALARLSCLWIQCHAHTGDTVRPFGKLMMR